ncbi:MAG: HlyD family type I secretion periplasmic adaptor subunit [Gammaproteobacteria bacterium]|nr:HlyD family type I secretion periplasmic adaptor subunit [Gammaproteobacteria bacterium]MBU1725429.1 HlyD family type I secretion periplasmic adaptor subunit [Gammaproteobacteria bacterium]MBU2005299.1 HlyD family type I secretion periplasmic adaptor subunit [Gammaproteobacteria bacterium]
MSTAESTSLERSIRRYITVGVMMLALLFLGIGGWTVMTRLSGAVIASGKVIVEGNQKAVQHVQGGQVSQLKVTEGASVEAGDLLMTLDGTSIRATLAVVERQAIELLANNLRLSAERDGDEAIKPVSELAGLVVDLDIPPEILSAQEKLFLSRKKSDEGQINQLHERIAQHKETITGLETQKKAKEDEFALVNSHLNRSKKLVDKKLLPKDQLITVETDLAVARGEIGQLTAEIARTKGMISELQYQIFQLHEQRLSNIIAELNDNKTRLAELLENRAELKSSLSKLEIRAPSSGKVHQLAVHTVGGVLGSGDVAMYIVPENERLIVEANVAPVDIDEVAIGQQVRLRLSSFDQNEVPDLLGAVINIAADVVHDSQTGGDHYPVRFLINPEEMEKLAGKKLQPGIPVQAFIETKSRTVLTYLLEPLADHLARAFRE